MAQGDGRFRASRGRLNSGSGDPRSSERARSTRRKSDRGTSRRSPVSVIETGEQEIHHDDVDLAERINSDDVSPDGTDLGDAEASKTSATTKSSARRNPSTRARSARRSRAGAPSLGTRLRSIDAKRAVILALVIGVVALALAPSLRNYFSQRSEYHQVAVSNADLNRQIAEYQQKVNEQGDPAKIEAEARARLQLTRPGETPLVMIFPDDEKREAEQQRAAERAQSPWYSTKGSLWSSISTPPE